ncbi:MAG: acetyl-CoA carboxylase biotin carboxyl carrier protein subunit [Burkholderiaceae bacterium]|jgi:biotin carboxyl carrier protein|nr:acetyl-CoA carboxylase biotin carboxyl carrier protein subunit [Burkholderiaceae bacterium]
MTTLIESPIAGLVAAVETTQGAPVARGDTLIIVESMKMEIPVESEVQGQVLRLLVAVGEQVAEGQAIAEIG